MKSGVMNLNTAFFEDEAFSAEVPGLAGCAADGKTYEEALKMLK
jgi:predicted RNase H-like HicB family nuclease